MDRKHLAAGGESPPRGRLLRWAAVVLLLPLWWVLPLFGSAGGPGAQGERIRVMTYNIHHGQAVDGTLDLGAVAALIRAYDADVVGLQEVDRHWSQRSAFADQVRALAEALGMHAFFAPIYDLPAAAEGAPRRQYGLAVLSRFPIAAAHNFEMTRLSTVEAGARPERMPGFPMVTVNVGDRLLHVFNVHLDYRPDPAVRRAQVAEVLERLAGVHGPVVLLGDFNAEPEAAELAPLRDVLRDAWSLRGAGRGATYPAEAPGKRIDGVYVSPEVRVDSVVVPVSLASDHRPVIADLMLPPAAP